MALSKIVVVVFVVIFIGFISLLVVFNVHTSYKRPSEIDDNENETHIDYLLDLSNPIFNPCSKCQPVTLRDLFCNETKFALIIRITDITSEPPFLVEKWSELKKQPDVKGNLVHLDPYEEEECQLKFKTDTVYLVTGHIDSNGYPCVSACDAVIEWSSLSRFVKHAYFNFFSPKLQC